PLVRRRARGIATVLALRTVVLLGVGFTILAAVATVSVIHTGLVELRQRHEADVRALAGDLGRAPNALLTGEAQLRLALFRAKEPTVAFVAAGGRGCTVTCNLAVSDRNADASQVRRALSRSWPTEAGHEYTVTLGGRPLLLVAEPIVDL